MNRTYIYIGGVVVIGLAAILAFWFVFANSGQEPTPTDNTPFGSSSNNATGATTDSSPDTNVPQQNVSSGSQQKIFKISDGPVAGATFIETSRPTATQARFIMAENGHAFDIVLDSLGAVPKALSNTTIPGAVSAEWTENGNGAVLQYLDGNTPKTVYLGFPSGTSTAPLRLQFYPDGITDLAASPDGLQISYTLRTPVGTDIYISKTDGTGSKKISSLPLQQLQLRWPSLGTLLTYSNSAAGLPGIAFAIDSKSGSVTPLVYAPGLTATADLTFSHVLYQTSVSSTGDRVSYSHSVTEGTDKALSIDPYPEKCIQSPQAADVVICAVPLLVSSSAYLDQWHQGSASATDSLMAFNLSSGTSTVLAAPGGLQGGTATDMLSIGASKDGHYLLFVSKYDRSLWGVRLQ